MTSTAWPVQVEMVSRMNADAPLKNTLQITSSRPQAVFSGGAPQWASRPYLVVGSVSEDDSLDGFGSSGGNDGKLTLHLYFEGPGNQEILEAIGHLDRIFNKQLIPINGFSGFLGRVRTIGVYDELFNNLPVSHGVVRFEYLVVPQ